MSTLILILTLAALLTAIISGIVGMAGGVTLLGVMSALLPPAQVVPLHGVAQLASNFTRTLVFLKHVVWRIFLVYALPMVAGVYGATLIWSGEKLGWFKPVIGVFILAFLIWRRLNIKFRNIPNPWYAAVGLVAGFATVFIGATGPLIAPFFLRDDCDKEEIIATKAICQSWGHALKIPAFLALGFDFTPHWSLLALLIAAVVLGTVIGKKLLGKLSREFFTVLYQSVLALLALYLIVAPLL